MTADQWRREHVAACAKQGDGAGTFVVGGGRRIRLFPGFEEERYSTVGDPTQHVRVTCNACGEDWSGEETSQWRYPMPYT